MNPLNGLLNILYHFNHFKWQNGVKTYDIVLVDVKLKFFLKYQSSLILQICYCERLADHSNNNLGQVFCS